MVNQYTSVGGTTRSHDGNGNLTDDGTYKFGYDFENRLVELRNSTTNALIASYRYDALGRRVEKDLGSNNEQRYIYSGLETIATYNAFDTWKQDFVYAQGIDRIVMLEQADVLDYDSDQDTSEATRSYYHRNALGSVIEISDANEATVVSYRYDPYGTVTITRGGQTQNTDPLGQHWTFTARFLDEETGLYYYRARMYHPGCGRFLQRDPLGYGPSPSLYEYVHSAPTNLTDPDGQDSERWRRAWGVIKRRLLDPVLDYCTHAWKALACTAGCSASTGDNPGLTSGWSVGLGPNENGHQGYERMKSELQSFIAGGGTTPQMESLKSEASAKCKKNCECSGSFSLGEPKPISPWGNPPMSATGDSWTNGILLAAPLVYSGTCVPGS